MSTTEKAFANLANIGPSEAEKAKLAEVNRSIARTMAEIVLTRVNDGSYRDPNQLTPNLKVTPAGAGKARVPGEWEPPAGWSEPQPLVTPESHSTDEAVRRLADHFAPHGPESPLRKAGGVPLLPGVGEEKK
jgi:hypothetical protein